MKNNSMQWVLGGALALIGLFVLIALIGVRSQADTVQTQANVTNVAPTVDTVYVDNQAAYTGSGAFNNGSTPIVISGGVVNASYHVHGTVSDDNGVGTGYGDGDIQNVALIFRSSTAPSGDNCSAPDANNCIKVDTCQVRGLDADTLEYDCSFDMKFWADSTDGNGVNGDGATWIAKVMVNDDGNLTSSSTVSTIEVATTLALHYPVTTINYGTLARAFSGATADAKSFVVRQYGNDTATVQVSGTTMYCSVLGQIPPPDQKWDLQAFTWNGGGTALTGTPSSIQPTFLNYRTHESNHLENTFYWNIKMPTAVSGSCAGTSTFSALAGS